MCEDAAALRAAASCWRRKLAIGASTIQFPNTAALFALSVWDIIAHCTMQLLGEFDALLNWKSPVGRAEKDNLLNTL